VTRPVADVERVLALHRLGHNKCEIARLTGIPRGTLRCWINPRYQPRARLGCFRCDDSQSAPSSADYVYLLGLYLGDGCLSAAPNGVWRLRIVQDARYKQLIQRCDHTMGAVSRRRVLHVARPGCVEISAYWKHWIHAFPQHGPGPKHKRAIRLEQWQVLMVHGQPQELLAGLVHSDGSRHMNPIIARCPDGSVRRYAYPRYDFCSASDDIRRLFTETCDLLGVTWTRRSQRNISIARRKDVAFLDTFIGPKS
jgi:hypothetical protein